MCGGAGLFRHAPDARLLEAANLERNIEAAQEAIFAYTLSGEGRGEALLAASIGPYATALPDRAETVGEAVLCGFVLTC